MQANNIKEQITRESLERIPERQKDGSWLSPAYLPVAIDVDDIVPQEANPNIQADTAFKALQTSILNTGYTFPILISENPLYEEGLDPKDKPSMRDKNRRVTEVRDPKLRRYFKYQIVDGSHRFAAILENEEIYNRENGTIPCIILRNKTPQELMSAEILMNSSRGTHTLDSMKEIVANLIDSGMSEDWIARNLYLEKEAIMRYKQLSGLASAFRDSNDFSKDVWDPIKDKAEERKKNVKMVQRARAYIRAWRKLANEEGGTFDVPIDLDIMAAAKNLGFSEDNPFIIPTKVDTETGEVIETGLVESETEETEE